MVKCSKTKFSNDSTRNSELESAYYAMLKMKNDHRSFTFFHYATTESYKILKQYLISKRDETSTLIQGNGYGAFGSDRVTYSMRNNVALTRNNKNDKKEHLLIDKTVHLNNQKK